MVMEAVVRVMLQLEGGWCTSQRKQVLLEAGKGRGRVSPYSLQKECSSANTLILTILDF